MEKTVFYTEPPAKTAKLSILRPDGAIYEVLITGKCTLGRRTQSSQADIPLDSAIASRLQGEFAVLDGHYYYRDLDSANGTFVNDVLYGGNVGGHRQATRLENGDVLRIDQSDGSGRHPQAVVMIFATAYNDSDQWGTQPLGADVAEINIGRATGKGIMLNDGMVSQNHASFATHQGRWYIADHASTNGVYLNNRRLTQSAYLSRGDVVRIINTHFIFLGDRLLYQANPYKKQGAPAGPQLSIHITRRSVWQRFKQLTLLENINLSVNSGEMVMILGGSGAGKTTFMNAVMGYEKAEGQIRHGQMDIYEDYDAMKYEIGFVPQQDLLRGSDTVYDTLQNAADMKLPASLGEAQKTERILQVLAHFGLQREREALVSKLSGGQRKRLSIAVEFISGPSLFFLDEPDSGLDGIMAKSLNEKLRAIADEGKIVMVITHSPDRVAHLYNKVIVLAKSVQDNCGHLAFYGSVQEAMQFFDTDSLEGVVKRINREDEGGDGMSDYYIQKYQQLIG